MISAVSQVPIPYTPPTTPIEIELARSLVSTLAIQQIASACVDINLPESVETLDEALFPLHRRIESQYRALPWPPHMQKIVVLTDVRGGRGDIVAAAKAIAIMQRISPTLSFDWVLLGPRLHQYDPTSFLCCEDPSKVHMRSWMSQPPEETAGDFLLTGPAKLGWGIDYIQSRIFRRIEGPSFGFMEIGEDLETFCSESLQDRVKRIFQKTNEEIYQSLHSALFPSKTGNRSGFLSMGLQPGSGVLLDRSRMEAPRSRGYCCPSY